MSTVIPTPNPSRGSRDLEQALKDRYPLAQVTVTGQGDGVTAAVNQPDDSIRISIDADRIQGGSAVLAVILGGLPYLYPSIFTERIHGTGNDCLRPQETEHRPDI